MELRKIGSNQTQLSLDNGTVVFFSYQTPVAAFVPGRDGATPFIRTSTRYSVTTSKHINQWLRKENNPPCVEVPQAEIDALLSRN